VDENKSKFGTNKTSVILENKKMQLYKDETENEQSGFD